MNENTIDTTDRISMLPDFILHHILSYLQKDIKTRVRMSVLSKRWFTLTASFPILYFHFYRAWFRQMSRKYDYKYIREMFYKYVDHTVSRFCDRNISAHTLNISADIMNLEQKELFGRYLDLFLGKGLHVMDIRFGHDPEYLSMFRLSNTLLSASSLISLTLYKCELPSSLIGGVVKFKSLKLLSLAKLPIEEGAIEYLTKSSPVLEEIFLKCCYGFKTFCVKRHNLQKVEIYHGIRLERIDVDAPNLSYFLLESNKEKAPSLFMGSCKKLTTFCYSRIAGGCPFSFIDSKLGKRLTRRDAASSKKMNENTIDTTDRISMLPDFILHYILSYLQKDIKTRVRMSVLSKRWFTLTASFPILYFHFYRAWFRQMSRKYDYKYIREMFYKYVDHTVSRFCEQNISAHTLNISGDIMNLEQKELFGRCLDLVLGKGLQVMDIRFGHDPEYLSMFRLSNTLLSASSLTSLTLYKCELPSSLIGGVVKFKSLKLLSLAKLPIEEGVIEYLTKSSPVLEEIFLKCCYGFKTFCVKRHHNLQKVEIYRGIRLERIDVDAPNLSYFLLESDKDKAPSLFMGSCKKLTTFCYSGFPLKRLNDFLSNFPFIENLYLDLSSHINNLKLSNQFLTTLRLNSCDLKEFDLCLCTPSLLLFEYCDFFSGSCVVSLLRKDSSLLNGCMKWVTAGPLDILQFQKLRQFLEKNSIFKLLKFEDIIDVEVLKLIQFPPYELEHVELDCIFEIPVYAPLLDVVLCCCRPRSLTLELDNYTDIGDVVEYTYEKLLQQEDEGQTNIYFSKDEQHFSDLNSLLKTPFHPSSCKITFIKEEVGLSNLSVMTEVHKVTSTLEKWILCLAFWRSRCNI
ncbi:F-box domain, Leucine-rich repeat domain, L domain-like protein [Artemisia annua]|uniref:F-box domain, Leucine-rich repeat domain, L domain-like protein n=1 Tax=Artemisia annua TaxID=35608 RepID=A0A2U1PCV4_ARTAN|nr:F-box domain, Leucine-rich repeat domain, L domain-like protein [Artemisia annua]